MYLAVLQAAIISSAATFLSGTRLAVKRSRGVLQGAVISNDASTHAGGTQMPEAAYGEPVTHHDDSSDCEEGTNYHSCERPLWEGVARVSAFKILALVKMAFGGLNPPKKIGTCHAPSRQCKDFEKKPLIFV